MTAESERLAAELRAIGADAAVLVRAEDICYATGFEVPPPIDAGAAFAYGPALAVVGRDGTTILLAPGAYAARADEMSLADETVLVDGFGHFEPSTGMRSSWTRSPPRFATSARAPTRRSRSTRAGRPSRCSRRSAHAPSPTFGPRYGARDS